MKKSSKIRQIFLAAIFLLALIGCSKGGNDTKPSNEYYLRATVGEKKIDFHMANFQLGESNGKITYVTVGGVETSPPSDGTLPPSGFDFSIWKLNGDITLGTYLTNIEEDMSATYFIYANKRQIFYDTISANDVFAVKIDAISKKGIKGSFSGTVRNETGEAIKVTDGYFNLPYQTIINP